MLIFFEVMDKEPSLPAVWGVCLLLGVAGFFLARKSPLFLLLVMPLTILFSLGHYLELNDPSVGQAIIREAGYGYLVQSYIAMFIGNLLPVAGFAVRLWQKEKTLS